MNVSVLGAGAWGTTLAHLLQLGHNQVTLWGHCPDHLDKLQRTRYNEKYLPGIELSPQLNIQSDIIRAVAIAECIVIAVPSEGFRDVTRHLDSFSGPVISVTKGIEHDSGLTMCARLR